MMRAGERWTLSVFCTYCGQPVAVECEPLPRNRGVYVCPYTSCSRENPIAGVKVLMVMPRESDKRIAPTG